MINFFRRFYETQLNLQAHMVQSSMIEKKRMYSAYRKAEQHMIMALKARKGEIKVRHRYSQERIAMQKLVS